MARRNVVSPGAWLKRELVASKRGCSSSFDDKGRGRVACAYAEGNLEPFAVGRHKVEEKVLGICERAQAKFDVLFLPNRGKNKVNAQHDHGLSIYDDLTHEQ